MPQYECRVIEVDLNGIEHQNVRVVVEADNAEEAEREAKKKIIITLGGDSKKANTRVLDVTSCEKI